MNVSWEVEEEISLHADGAKYDLLEEEEDNEVLARQLAEAHKATHEAKLECSKMEAYVATLQSSLAMKEAKIAAEESSAAESKAEVIDLGERLKEAEGELQKHISHVCVVFDKEIEYQRMQQCVEESAKTASVLEEKNQSLSSTILSYKKRLDDIVGVETTGDVPAQFQIIRDHVRKLEKELASEKDKTQMAERRAGAEEQRAKDAEASVARLTEENREFGRAAIKQSLLLAQKDSRSAIGSGAKTLEHIVGIRCTNGAKKYFSDLKDFLLDKDNTLTKLEAERDEHVKDLDELRDRLQCKICSEETVLQRKMLCCAMLACEMCIRRQGSAARNCFACRAPITLDQYGLPQLEPEGRVIYSYDEELDVVGNVNALSLPPEECSFEDLAREPLVTEAGEVGYHPLKNTPLFGLRLPVTALSAADPFGTSLRQGMSSVCTLCNLECVRESESHEFVFHVFEHAENLKVAFCSRKGKMNFQAYKDHLMEIDESNNPCLHTGLDFSPVEPLLTDLVLKVYQTIQDQDGVNQNQAPEQPQQEDPERDQEEIPEPEAQGAESGQGDDTEDQEEAGQEAQGTDPPETEEQAEYMTRDVPRIQLSLSSPAVRFEAVGAEAEAMITHHQRRRSDHRNSIVPIVMEISTREEDSLAEEDWELKGSESEEDFLRLSISGRRFRLLRRRLLKKGNNPPSRLEQLADADLDRSVHLRLSHGWLPDTKEWFFARSAAVFDHLLQAYYQYSPALHCPLHLCPESFARELAFWRIPFTALAPCCALRLEPIAAKLRLLPSQQPDVLVEEDEEAAGVARPNGSSATKAPLLPNNSSASIRLNSSAADAEAGREDDPDIPDEFTNACFGKPRRVVWNFMEDPGSSKPAKVFSLASISVVVASVLTLIVGSIPEFQVQETMAEAKPHPILQWIEIVCIIWFTTEYIVRFFLSATKLEFVKSAPNVVDVLSVLPFYVELGLELSGISTEKLGNVRGALLTLRILRVLRVARIFKLAKYSGGLQSFGQTLKASYREIGMLMLFLSTTIVLFSTTVYFLEKDIEDTPFTSIPATFWWCIVTMTTVGYGDMTPITVGGKLVASLTSVSGVIVLAFPITIIVENFNKYYRQGTASRPSSAPPSAQAQGRVHGFGMM